MMNPKPYYVSLRLVDADFNNCQRDKLIGLFQNGTVSQSRGLTTNIINFISKYEILAIPPSLCSNRVLVEFVLEGPGIESNPALYQRLVAATLQTQQLLPEVVGPPHHVRDRGTGQFNTVRVLMSELIPIVLQAFWLGVSNDSDEIKHEQIKIFNTLFEKHKGVVGVGERDGRFVSLDDPAQTMRASKEFFSAQTYSSGMLILLYVANRWNQMGSPFNLKIEDLYVNEFYTLKRNAVYSVRDVINNQLRFPDKPGYLQASNNVYTQDMSDMSRFLDKVLYSLILSPNEPLFERTTKGNHELTLALKKMNVFKSLVINNKTNADGGDDEEFSLVAVEDAIDSDGDDEEPATINRSNKYNTIQIRTPNTSKTIGFGAAAFSLLPVKVLREQPKESRNKMLWFNFDGEPFCLKRLAAVLFILPHFQSPYCYKSATIPAPVDIPASSVLPFPKSNTGACRNILGPKTGQQVCNVLAIDLVLLDTRSTHNGGAGMY